MSNVINAKEVLRMFEMNAKLYEELSTFNLVFTEEELTFISDMSVVFKNKCEFIKSNIAKAEVKHGGTNEI